MKPRINMITLGVKDIARSRDFYEKGLGWKASSMSNENFVVISLNGIVLCLYQEELLAEDALQKKCPLGFRGVTVSQNVTSKAEVNQVLEHAKAIGAKIVKPAQEVFWGGYSGYFADPDDNLWEVAWNPYWPIKENGFVDLPE
ncbi:MAG: VOC family protein [Parachlamydiaceae bacterium]|nr:VOC family protein [Parachlamydiaceae bacterium]